MFQIFSSKLLVSMANDLNSTIDFKEKDNCPNLRNGNGPKLENAYPKRKRTLPCQLKVEIFHFLSERLFFFLIKVVRGCLFVMKNGKWDLRGYHILGLNHDLMKFYDSLISPLRVRDSYPLSSSHQRPRGKLHLQAPNIIQNPKCPTK